MGVRARLIPRLSAARSMLSIFSLLVGKGTFDGKSVFINAYPGRNRTKIAPNAYLK